MGGKTQVLLFCGVCFKARGAKKTFGSEADLQRHASVKHPGLGYVPVKRVLAG